MKDCIEKYVKELDEKPDISSHCDRLQVIKWDLNEVVVSR